MPLKNPMEDNKLDFSQPLMSVRRFSSTGAEEKKTRSGDRSGPKIPPLPVYKSELKSGPVRNPGTVPFQWEKIPGKPKDESKPPSLPFRKPPASPKPPPGRNSNADNVVPVNQTEIHEMGGEEDDYRKRERKESLDSGGSDEAYLDAQDTLSRTESFFINCSFSGLSEFESTDSTQFETFSTDLQTRDFMIRRFLPAAKAMATETPQHPIKKQIPQKNPPWELQKVAGGGKRQLPLNSYAQMVSTHYAHDIDSDEFDNEDNNSLYDYSSAKICGLLPWFCLLNPIPAMKPAAAPPEIPVHRSKQNEKKRVTEFHNGKPKPKGQTDCSNPKNGTWNSAGLTKQNTLLSNAAEEDMAGVDSQRRCFREFLENDQDSCGAMVEKTLYIDSVHKLKSPRSNSSCLDNSEVKINEVNEASLVKSSILENLNVSTPNNNSKSLKPASGMTIELDSQCCSRSEYRCSKENSDTAMDPRNQFLKSSNGGRQHSPLAPPLPKSPSESWLKRTLQTAPRSSRSSRLSSTCMASKTISFDPKWNGNVKTAQNDHGNMQFSEVFLAAIPEL